MQTLKLLSAFLKVNIQMALAYRADTVVNILLNLMWLGWELLSLNIIFSNTTTLGGWGLGELIALLGVFRLVNTLMIALIWPNTEKFNQSIRDGSMDYTILQPVNSMFLVTFSRITVWRIWDLVLAIILIVFGINMAGDITTPYASAFSSASSLPGAPFFEMAALTKTLVSKTAVIVMTTKVAGCALPVGRREHLA